MAQNNDQNMTEWPKKNAPPPMADFGQKIIQNGPKFVRRAQKNAGMAEWVNMWLGTISCIQDQVLMEKWLKMVP